MPRITARDRILSAAAHRFYSGGITATGIDAITAEAGVAKQSLYNNFASKSDLVSTYIDERHGEWLALHEAREAAASTPRERVLAVFDAYLDHARGAADQAFRGCGLLNAAAEFPAGSPERAAVRRHKEEVEAILAAALDGAGDGTLTRAAARELAGHLSLLLEGGVARAGLEGTTAQLERAKRLAEQLTAGV
ncbi:TetR/AcrR family transcriptional regulator [Leucobacter luti]|uniref:TetR/AcrR family transcriptional regulator n=1 Tax=Leucobacter luti TaxID=340320 RepID=UPI003D069362